MDDYALDLGGKTYISSKRAAEITGYTKDYVGQLARGGKIDAKLVGRNWYINEKSILAHKRDGTSRRGKAEVQQAQREREDRILNEGGIAFEKDETPLIPQPLKSDVAEKDDQKTKVSNRPTDNTEIEATSVPVTVQKTVDHRTPVNTKGTGMRKSVVTEGVPTQQQEIYIPEQSFNNKDSDTPSVTSYGGRKKRYRKEVSPLLGALVAAVLLAVLTGAVFVEKRLEYSQERLELIGDAGVEASYGFRAISEVLLSASAFLNHVE